MAESQGAKENRQQAAIPDLRSLLFFGMVVYGLALGNQRQLNGGDFSTRTDELWPPAARHGQPGWPQATVDDILQFQCISMEPTMQVSKWGNSLAVRLPATVVDALGLKEGDQIEIQIAAKHTFAVAKAPGTRELLARLRKFRGRLPATFKFDRLEANERR